MRSLTEAAYSAQAPGAVPNENRSVMRPSRPTRRPIRDSSLVDLAFISTRPLNAAPICPMSVVRRSGRRTEKLPSLTASNAARSSCSGASSTPAAPSPERARPLPAAAAGAAFDAPLVLAISFLPTVAPQVRARPRTARRQHGTGVAKPPKSTRHLPDSARPPEVVHEPLQIGH